MLMMEAHKHQEDEDELISNRRAVTFLSELWGQPVTPTSLRMLRLRRKNDPDMPQPDFADGDVLLWRRSTLRKIRPPKKYNRNA